jgi:hypothetical protein
MKKLFLWILATSLLGCATTKNIPAEDPYKTLTIEKVSKYCKPINIWNVGVLGNPAMVGTFEHCLEINDLVVIITSYLENSKELDAAVIAIVRLSYLAYLNDTNTEKVYSAKLLKETYKEHKDEENAKSHVSFYSIESTKKTK